MLFDLYASTLTLQLTDVASAEHRRQGIIFYIFSNRLFKAIRVGAPTETRHRPFLKVKFADKGIDALNLSNMLDLHMFYMLRPVFFPNLSLFFRTMLFKHLSVLSRFCSMQQKCVFWLTGKRRWPP